MRMHVNAFSLFSNKIRGRSTHSTCTVQSHISAHRLRPHRTQPACYYVQRSSCACVHLACPSHELRELDAARPNPFGSQLVEPPNHDRDLAFSSSFSGSRDLPPPQLPPEFEKLKPNLSAARWGEPFVCCCCAAPSMPETSSRDDDPGFGMPPLPNMERSSVMSTSC